MNHSEIRFVVRSKVDHSITSYWHPKKGQYYRKGSWEDGRGWYDNPFDATLFTAKQIKNVRKLNLGIDFKDVEVVEVDITMTDRFPQPPEDSNGR